MPNKSRMWWFCGGKTVDKENNRRKGFILKETAYGTIINKIMQKDEFKINNKSISGFGAFIFVFKRIFYLLVVFSLFTLSK